jgi:hypothetical protein
MSVKSRRYCTSAAAVLLLLLWPGQQAQERPPRLDDHLNTLNNLLNAISSAEVAGELCRAQRGNICKETVVPTGRSAATSNYKIIFCGNCLTYGLLV